MSHKLPGHAMLVNLPMASPAATKRVTYLPLPTYVQFLELVKPIAKHCLTEEKGTHTYYWTLPADGDETNIKILEMFAPFSPG